MLMSWQTADGVELEASEDIDQQELQNVTDLIESIQLSCEIQIFLKNEWDKGLRPV